MTRLLVLLGRFVGLAIAILGIWVFGSNVAGIGPTEAQTLALTLSAVGAVGGVLFLASLADHGPLRSRWIRVIGWAGMLTLAVLPFSFWMYTLPFVLLVVPTLFIELSEGARTRELQRSVN